MERDIEKSSPSIKDGTSNVVPKRAHERNRRRSNQNKSVATATLQKVEELSISAPTTVGSQPDDTEYRKLHDKLREQNEMIKQLAIAQQAQDPRAGDDRSKAAEGGSKRRRRRGNKDKDKDHGDAAAAVEDPEAAEESPVPVPIAAAVSSTTLKPSDGMKVPKSGNARGDPVTNTVQRTLVDANVPSKKGSAPTAKQQSSGVPSNNAGGGGHRNDKNEKSGSGAGQKSEKSGGMLKVNTTALQANANKEKSLNRPPGPNVKAPAPAREAREGVDFPKRKHATADMLARLKLTSEKDALGSSNESSIDHELQQISTVEAAAQTALESIKNSKELSWEVCVLGLAVGAPASVHGPIDKLEGYYLDFLAKSLDHCVTAAKAGIPARLWTVRRKQLEIFQQVVKSSIPDNEKRIQVLRNYVDLVNTTKIVLTVAAGHVERWMKSIPDQQAPNPSEAGHSLREGLCTLLMALGDVSRYGDALERQMHKSKKAGGHDQQENVYQQYYIRARDCCPWNGNAYKCLTYSAKDKSNWSACIFWWLCAFTAKSAFSGDRNALLECLDRMNQNMSGLAHVSVLSGLSVDDHRMRFQGHLQQCLGIALTRIDADMFETQSDKCKRHLALALQLFSGQVDSMARSKGGASAAPKGEYFEYSKSLETSTNTFSAIIDALAPSSNESTFRTTMESLENDVFKCIVMIILGLQMIGNKYYLDAITNRGATVASPSLDNLEEETSLLQQMKASERLDDEDYNLMMKRLSVIRLQRAQRIPGLADLFMLLLSFVCALLGRANAASASASSVSESTEAVSIVVGLRSLTVFFEWLHKNPSFHVMVFNSRSDWESLEAATSVYLDRLPKVKTPGEQQLVSDNFLACLPEDELLVGLSPFAGYVDARVGPSGAVSEKSTVDSVLNLTGLLVRASRLRSAVAELSNCNLFVARDLPLPVGYDATTRHPRPCRASDAAACLKLLSLRTQPSALTTRPTLPTSGGLLSKEEFHRGLGIEMDDNDDVDDDDEVIVFEASNIGDTTAETAPVTAPMTSGLSAGLLRVPDRDSLLQNIGGESSAVNDHATAGAGAGVGANDRRSKQGAGRKSANKYELSLRKSVSAGTLPLIVVDAANVAMRHGLNAKFSCKGIQIVLNFFQAAGHRVLSFLPDYYLSYEEVSKKRVEARLNLKDQNLASRIPDDVKMLLELQSRGLIFGTPSFDYDDEYCLRYARTNDGYIVSNDLFRDHTEKIINHAVKKETRRWLKEHCISYTFVGNEFLPNPEFEFK